MDGELIMKCTGSPLVLRTRLARPRNNLNRLSVSLHHHTHKALHIHLLRCTDMGEAAFHLDLVVLPVDPVLASRQVRTVLHLQAGMVQVHSHRSRLVGLHNILEPHSSHHLSSRHP